MYTFIERKLEASRRSIGRFVSSFVAQSANPGLYTEQLIDDLTQVAWIEYWMLLRGRTPGEVISWTYLKKRMKGAIIDFLRREMPYTRSQYDAKKQIARVRKQLLYRGIDPRDSNVVRELGWTFERFNWARTAGVWTVSIDDFGDVTTAEDEGGPVAGSGSDMAYSRDPLTLLMESEEWRLEQREHELFTQAVAMLDRVEALIVRRRHLEGKTFHAIGLELGVTHGRIWQINEDLIVKLIILVDNLRRKVGAEEIAKVVPKAVAGKGRRLSRKERLAARADEQRRKEEIHSAIREMKEAKKKKATRDASESERIALALTEKLIGFTRKLEQGRT